MDLHFQGDYALVHCPACGHLHGFHREEVDRISRASRPACKGCGQVLFALAAEALGMLPWKRRLMRFLMIKLLALSSLALGFAWQLPDREQTLLIANNLRYRVNSATGEWKAIAPVFRNIDDLPDHVEQLLLTSEDSRFHWHPGVDPFALMRALKKGKGGGSTITQQLARTLAGYDQSPTLSRKIRELVFALKLELDFSKREILQMYLNNVWFGNGAYGIENASREYFGKRSSQLSAMEAAILIQALPKPNSNWQSDRTRSERRATALLERTEQRFAPYSAAQRQVVTGSLRRRVIDTASIYDSIRSRGLPACGTNYLLVTTINPTTQIYAELAIKRQLRAYRARGARNGALISLGPRREVVALVTTADRQLSQFDHVYQGHRPPGSAIKPLIYLAALQNGWSLDDEISAARFVDPASGWAPHNHNGRYPERITLRAALAQSYNTAAVRLLQAVGPAKVRKLALELGFDYDNGQSDDLAMALGAGTTTLRELVDLYSTIAWHGDARASFSTWGGVSQSTWGTCQWRDVRAPLPTSRGDRAYEQLSDGLREVMRTGTGAGARLVTPNYLGKTGTSDNYRDAWFVGINGVSTTAIWFGGMGRGMDRVQGGEVSVLAYRSLVINAQLK